MNKNVDAFIRLFVDFLKVNWTLLGDILESHDWKNDPDIYIDWLQANWEILVERQILDKKNQYLTPFALTKYGHRWTSTDKSSTHFILCKPLENLEDIDDNDFLVFRCIMGNYGGSWGVFPDFNYVSVLSVKQDKLYEFELSKFEFELQKIPTEMIDEIR